MLYTYLQKYKGGGEMNMMLTENIRAFCKERSLTQEQLFEMLTALWKSITEQ